MTEILSDGVVADQSAEVKKYKFPIYSSLEAFVKEFPDWKANGLHLGHFKDTPTIYDYLEKIERIENLYSDSGLRRFFCPQVHSRYILVHDSRMLSGIRCYEAQGPIGGLKWELATRDVHLDIVPEVVDFIKGCKQMVILSKKKFGCSLLPPIIDYAIQHSPRLVNLEIVSEESHKKTLCLTRSQPLPISSGLLDFLIGNQYKDYLIKAAQATGYKDIIAAVRDLNSSY